MQEYTRGPCPEGQLMVLDRDTGYGQCSCDSNLVKKTTLLSRDVVKIFTCNQNFSLCSFQRMYFHEPSGQCYELYKRGPCPQGHILSFNYGSLSPQCKCKDGYHLHADGKCYRLNTRGDFQLKSKLGQNPTFYPKFLGI